MRWGPSAAALMAAAFTLTAPAGASAQGTTGDGENITHVANVAYPNLHAPREVNAGTDVEFATIRGKR